MNGDVGAAIQQGHFEFLEEQAFSADFGQWRRKQFVAPCREWHKFDFSARMGLFEALGHVPRLPQGERAFPGRDAQGLGHSPISTRLEACAVSGGCAG